MEKNERFFAELEIVRFEDTDVITTSCDAFGCPCDVNDPPVQDG